MSNRTPNITNPQDFSIYGNTLHKYKGLSDYIVVPDGVEEIFVMCFNGQKAHNIVLPNSLVKINHLAFKDCENLTSIIIPDKVKEIEDAAFKGCINLSSIVIGNNVVSIGASAFSGCEKLKKISIPASVMCIGEWSFYDCFNLTAIDVDENNPNFSSVDGVLYNKDKTVLIQYPAGKGNSEFKIPESVTKIGNRAFYGCKNLETIVTHDSIKFIGEDAFTDSAFYNNSSNWEDDVLYLGDYLVKARTSKKGHCNIKAGTRIIVDSAFSKCNNITSVFVPDSVLLIGQNAFDTCVKLESITISEGVKAIDKFAFYKCNSLIEVAIPDSVIALGYGVFSNCKRLKIVDLSANLKGIPGMFVDCESLESIVIPNGVKNINSAFSGCKNLKSVVIPNGVENINSAFSECKNLKSVEIPDTVRSMDGTFNGCMNLTSVSIPNGVSSLSGTFCGCKKLSSITIPSSVKLISDAFSGCDNLTSVNITDVAAWCSIDFVRHEVCDAPDVLSNPLEYAHNLYLNGEIVQDLVIPDGVTKITEYAFQFCTSITSVKIPDSVKYIGEFAFSGCKNLSAVYITDLAAWCNINFDRISKYHRSEGTYSNPLMYAHNLYINGEFISDLVIPEGTTEINAYAFYNCSNIISVKIPDTVKTIRNYAFGNCRNLSSISFSHRIGGLSKSVFGGCSNIIELNIPDELINRYINGFTEELVYSIRRKKGVCQFCGGEFKGLFKKKCVKCDKTKNY